MPDEGIDMPAAWAGLLAESDDAAGDLRMLKDDAAFLEDERGGRGVSAGFLGAGVILARGAVLASPDAAADAASAYTPFLADAVKEADAGEGADPGRRVDLLQFAAVARACGAKLPADAKRIEADWLPALAEQGESLDEFVREEMAFACVAAGQPERVAELLGAALPKSAPAGKTFGPNFGGLAKYLAAAVRDGAALDDVEPAFADFLAEFPDKLEAGTADWPALFWCARAVLSTIGGRAEGEVAAEIHRRVRA